MLLRFCCCTRSMWVVTSTILPTVNSTYIAIMIPFQCSICDHIYISIAFCNTAISIPYHNIEYRFCISRCSNSLSDFGILLRTMFWLFSSSSSSFKFDANNGSCSDTTGILFFGEDSCNCLIITSIGYNIPADMAPYAYSLFHSIIIV